MEIESGDLLELPGPEGPRYCEVAAVLDNHLEVWLVEKRGWTWQYNDEWCTIPISQPTRHVKVRNRDYRAAYKTLGFRPLDGVHFVKTSEASQIPPHVTLPLGVDTDSEPEEPTESDLEFIASDEEPFTYADTDYAKDTHAAVREYNLWQPTTPDGQRIKAFIDYLDHKYCVPAQEQSWWAGHSINFTKPPV